MKVNLLVTVVLVFISTGICIADLSGIKIGIDPGHGGTEPGAVGPTGLTEKSINLSTSLYLKSYLEGANASVYMTRTTDVTVSLSTRSAYFNSIPVNRAISVHHNASESASANYTGVHVYLNNCYTTSGDLASVTVQRLNAHMGIGYVYSNCSRTGVHQDDFHMVRETTMPAVLTENSFISNPAEETRLRNASYLQANGWAIFAGVCDHYGQSPSTATPTPVSTATPTMTPGPGDVIVDNSDPGCSVQGTTWEISTWGTNYGADKLYSDSGAGAGSVTWSASLPTGGQYHVYAWVTNGAYTTTATYTVHHAGGDTVVTRSQQNMGGGWAIDIGTFSFNSTGSITINDNAANGIVVADAVKFTLVSAYTNTPTFTPTNPANTATPTPTASTIPVYIIDNVDPGCSVQGTTWEISTWGANYGIDKLYTDSGTGAGSVTWTTNLQSGQYQLHAWVNEGAYTTVATYTIHHAGGDTVIQRSQSNQGGSWAIDLGTYSFVSSGSVTISDDVTNGWVVADAVRFTFTGSFTATPTSVATNTRTPTLSPTRSPTLSPTRTPTPASPTATFTRTPTVTLTPTFTNTPLTPTPTATPTVSGVPTYIIDNVDAGCHVYGSSWEVSTWGNNYGVDKLYTDSGTGTGRVNWSMTIPPGVYQIDAWVTNGAYSSNATYTVHHLYGDTVVVRSQDYQGGGWDISLGTFHIMDQISVDISDNASSGIVVADAVRFSYISALPATYTPTPFPSGAPTLTPTPTRTATTTRTPTKTATPTPSGAPTNTPTPTMAPTGETRAIWVKRWSFSSPADIDLIVQRVAQAGFNVIMFQVRGRADAFYQSDYEPWASELSGTLGQDPGWDPLGYAIQKAHQAGIELHAWLNTYPCWSGLTAPIHTTPEHIYNAHPEWLACDQNGTPMQLNSSYVNVSPGIPAVNDHIINVCMDIISKYNVDGIHFDYIRYPGQNYSHDPVSEYRFINDNPLGLSWDNWQRDQISQFVARAYAEMTTYKPRLVVSAAVWGIYIDYWGWNTSEGYYNYYQDSQRWVQENSIDAICPMIYWNIADIPHFDVLLDDFVSHMGDRHVYAGMSGSYSDFTEIYDEIAYTRSSGAQGNVIFDYDAMQSHAYWDDILGSLYGADAPPAPMPWKYAITPTPVPTFTRTATPTRSPTATNSPVPTATRTPTSTLSHVPTATVTRTPTASNPPTATFTNTPVFTPTMTQSPTFTPTNTYEPTGTFTAAPTFTPTLPIPDVPTIYPEPDYTAGNSNVIRWSDEGASGAFEYYAECSFATDFSSNSTISSGWQTAVSYTFENLLDGRTYYYRVKSRNTSQSESDWSEVVSSTQDATVPTIFYSGYFSSLVSAQNGGYLQFLVYAMDNSGIQSVEILYNDMTTGVWLYDDGSNGDTIPNDHLFTLGLWLPTDNNLPIGFPFLFSFEATDLAGNRSAAAPYLEVE